MRPEEQLGSQTIKEVAGAPETVRESDKIQLILAYLGILALVPLLTVKDSELVKWHAKNGLVLGLGGGIALMIGLFVLGAVFAPLGFLGCLAWPALLVVDILAMVKALKGERWRIPLVTDIAEKL